jgi:CRP-like cAMP-binding protein
MELLETARVDAYKKDDIIVPASRRSEVLCVVWEGTCAESPADDGTFACNSQSNVSFVGRTGRMENTAVWHAGDWTGPISLQPESLLSGESASSKTHDVVAVSLEGVKVITVENSSLHYILKNGSPLYGKYLERKLHQERAKLDLSSSEQHSTTTEKLLDDALKDLNVLELLNCNSALRKLNAVQKRHLESLAEGPISFQPGERLWRAGGPVDRAFVIISGSASFVAKRRNAGSATIPSMNAFDEEKNADGNLGIKMQLDAKRAINELARVSHGSDCDTTLSSREHDATKSPSMPLEKLFNNVGVSEVDNPDYERLKKGLEKRANHINTEGSVTSAEGESHGDHGSYDTDNDSQLDFTFIDETDSGHRTHRSSLIRRRSSRARQANKVLGRLYNRRAFTEGLVFSRGHFLGDVSKMVAGLLSSDLATDVQYEGPSFGFGDHVEGSDDPITQLTIQEEEGTEQVTHSSTLTAGKDGCVVLVFPKSSIIPFLDQYPGLLLSLLGTQVVV